MSFLEDRKVYLSGPIEYQKDISWRDPVIQELSTRFKINVFDPHSDPKQQWAIPLKEAKDRGDWEIVRTIAKSFVRKDLCMVDRADILISYLPYKVPTTGTHHEIINSVNAKKPTLLVADGNIANIPSWYFGFVPYEVMFPSFEALYEYLQEVDDGKHISNNRWAYVYGLV